MSESEQTGTRESVMTVTSHANGLAIPPFRSQWQHVCAHCSFSRCQRTDVSCHSETCRSPAPQSPDPNNSSQKHQCARGKINL